MMPNLFVIGFPKAGTTWVHSMLSKYRDVSMSWVKEPGYFSNDHIYERGREYYLKTFFPLGRGGVWLGEATPWYVYSGIARSRIRSDCEASTRLIVCLRDPALRAVSMYRDQVRAGRESRSPAAALNPAEAAHEGAQRLEQRYITGGLYEQYLDPWLADFGRNHVLTISERELSEPQRFHRKVVEFLGLQEPMPDAGTQVRNSASGVRSQFLQKSLDGLLARDQSRQFLRRLLPEAAARRAFQLVVGWNHAAGPPIDIDTGIVTSLKTYYAPTIDSLQQQAGISLNHWRDD